MKALSVQGPVSARAWGLLLLVLALAMVLAVAACDSEEDPTATSTSGTAPAQNTPTSEAQPENTPTGQDQGSASQTGSSQTGSSGDTQMDGEPLQVVATSNIVADWVRNIGGDRVEVISLLPIGGDPHTYQPGARDVAQIVDADLVLTVGLELEGGWLEELIHNASADESRIVALGELIDPIPFAETGGHHAADPDHEDEDEDHDEGMEEDEDEEHHDEDDEDMDEEEGHEDDEDMDEDEDHEEDEDEDHEEDEDEDHGDEEEHGHGELDPHFWFDPGRVRVAVIEIATRLAMLDPEGVQTYTENATAYVAQLEELHAWTEQQLSSLPNERRILVTSHDSLSYFAVIYGFEVVGTVIPSGTTETESSAEQLAELIEIIEHEGVPAVFGETTVSERIARAVADETGAGFYSLYSGSLGAAGSGADTYLTMVRSNVEIIAQALS